MMDKIKRYIEVAIPCETCNLRCHYCYITQHGKFKEKIPKMEYSAEFIAHKALSKERLGGTCLMNLCAGGETLIPKFTIDFTRELLEEGHYVSLVTNGTLSKRFNEIANFDKELLKRLFIKFSYQFLELKRLNLIDKYFQNILKMKENGVSFAVEITSNDEIIPYLDEAKEICYKYLGAYPHITIGRKDSGDIEILTNLSKDEYKKVWDKFDSGMFKFKFPIFGEKRKEFCYAGDWSFCLNLKNGDITQCYRGKYLDNIYKNVDKPIKFMAIGNQCKMPHCYNAHAFLTLGAIPNFTECTYCNIRNRVCNDGTEWLQPEVKAFFSSKLQESNTEYDEAKKQKANKFSKNNKRTLLEKISSKLLNR